MNPDYEAQLQRLRQFRRSFAEQNALRSGQDFGRDIEDEPLQDPLIFAGLYAPSGIDMMGILVRIRTRPNPTFDIGNVDSSVALVLCDTGLPDNPIVYCSEPFEILTKYSSSEVLGRNCRFLQHPHPNALNNVQGTTVVDERNTLARTQLRDKIAKVEEVQVRLVNYTKSGVKFFNILTVIPIAWNEGEAGKRYLVGFQAQDNFYPA